MCNEGKMLDIQGVLDFVGARRVGVYVAHPDDETLWAGGLLAALPSTTIVYACSIPVRDPERAARFFDACAALDVQGRLLPHPEVLGGSLTHLDLYKDTMEKFDVILTHGINGEYGHLHHIQVHTWVLRNTRRHVLLFGDAPGYELDDDLVKKKMDALACYDHCSPTDRGKTKYDALVELYGISNIKREGYEIA